MNLFVLKSNALASQSRVLRWLAVTALAIAFVVAASLGLWANNARLALRNEVEIAGKNLSVALTALANFEAGKRPVNAANSRSRPGHATATTKPRSFGRRSTPWARSCRICASGG